MASQAVGTALAGAWREELKLPRLETRIESEDGGRRRASGPSAVVREEDPLRHEKML